MSYGIIRRAIPHLIDATLECGQFFLFAVSALIIRLLLRLSRTEPRAGLAADAAKPCVCRAWLLYVATELGIHANLSSTSFVLENS
jgi:hypothetical protein